MTNKSWYCLSQELKGISVGKMAVHCQEQLELFWWPGLSHTSTPFLSILIPQNKCITQFSRQMTLLCGAESVENLVSRAGQSLDAFITRFGSNYMLRAS